MATTLRKAFVCLTRHGRELLVLAHPLHPTASLQVPAGTMQRHERPEAAALRELAEETGLERVRLAAFLGERLFDMRPFGKDELHHRFFYHAELLGEAHERWRYAEDHAGPAPLPFELSWWRLADGVPDLGAGHGDLLHRLPPPRP